MESEVPRAHTLTDPMCTVTHGTLATARKRRNCDGPPTARRPAAEGDRQVHRVTVVLQRGGDAPGEFSPGELRAHQSRQGKIRQGVPVEHGTADAENDGHGLVRHGRMMALEGPRNVSKTTHAVAKERRSSKPSPAVCRFCRSAASLGMMQATQHRTLPHRRTLLL